MRVRCMDIEKKIRLNEHHISAITEFSPFTFYLVENHTHVKLAEDPFGLERMTNG